MKTPQQQPGQNKQLNFYRKLLNASPTSKPNSNYLTSQQNKKPQMSKLEINFPKIKICESRKYLTEQSISSQTQQLHNFPFNSNSNFNQNQPFSGANINSTAHNDNNFASNQIKINKLSSEDYMHKKERSPVRYNQYSYQETTKEDYQQVNTPSYNQFFKAPTQINSAQIGFNNTLIPFIKEMESKKQCYQQKYEDPFHTENKEGYYRYKDNQAVIKNNDVKYVELQKNPIIQNIQQPIKQKGNMTLSQLLIDLHRRSQKLYQIYGQNNQDYQKCIENMQNHQQTSSINYKPSSIEQKSIKKHQTQQTIQNHIQKKQNDIIEPNNRDKYTFSKKYIDKKEDASNLFDDRSYTKAAEALMKTQVQNKQDRTDKIYTEENYQKTFNYAPIKQKSYNTDQNAQEKCQKQSPFNSQLNPQTKTTKGIISASKSLSKESSVLQKKKKVMFYHEEDQSRQQKQQKAAKLAICLLRFFNKFLLNLLRSNYFYQTGFLSTESNIHATSGRNLEENQDRSRDTNKDTSFFQEYLQRKDKISSEDILCNMMGEGVRKNSDEKVRKDKKQNMILLYPLLPIEEQIESSYGLSMMGSSQRKKVAQLTDKQYENSQKEKTQKFQTKPIEQNCEWKFKQHMNTAESRKVEELMIQSVDKKVFQNQLNPKKELSQKLGSIKFDKFANGLDKISEIFKYKILTHLRSSYLTLKFFNSQASQKGQISSLKISEVSRPSVTRNEKSSQISKSKDFVVNKQQQMCQKQNTNIQAKSSISPSLSIHSVNKNQNIKDSEIYQPKNILEHYYKKSSPNSQTNEYASIVNNPKQQVQLKKNKIESKHEDRTETINIKISPQPLTTLRQSQFFPLSPSHKQSVIEQNYYKLSSQNNPPLNSNISHTRSGRALSSSSSKVMINYFTPLNQLFPGDNQRITTEALLNGRQSDLPVYSPSSINSQLGQNQQQYSRVDDGDGNSERQKILKQSHLSNYGAYNSGMYPNLAQYQQSPNFTVANSQQSHVKQIPSHQFSQIPKIRPSLFQNKALDHLSLKGKIARSYSENDFKNYYNHNHDLIQPISPTNLFNSNLNNLRASQLPHRMRSSHLQTRSRTETVVDSSNFQDAFKGNKIHDLSSNVGSSVKNSVMIKNSQMINKPSNLMSPQIPLYAPNYPLNKISSIPQTNHQMPINFPLAPDIRTIRPIVRFLNQKRRSQSLSSFLNYAGSLEQGQTTPSMLKQLKKPYIQVQHSMSAQQQNYSVENKFHNLKMQPQMYPNQFPLCENRPRISRSVDQCVIRPSSFSRYQEGNSKMDPYQVNNAVKQPYQQQNIFASHNIKPVKQTNHVSSHSTNNYINNRPIPQKHVEVDSEYHLMKTNFQLVKEGDRQNLYHINAKPSTFKNQSNQIMKESFRNGSRIKYEEQNLIVGNGISPRSLATNAQADVVKQQHFSSQQPNNYYQKPVLSPTIAFQSSKSKIKLTKSPVSPSLKSPTFNHPSLSQTPKPKSPSTMPKAKSPEPIKIKNQTTKYRESKLSNYGQN